jgi:hypothetical protein
MIQKPLTTDYLTKFWLQKYNFTTVCHSFVSLITKYTNIATKFNWKLFTKVFKRQVKEAWVWIDRVSSLKEKHQPALLI